MENIIKVDIPKGYEFVEVTNQQIVFEKICCQYPKTYEECCRIIDYHLEGTTIIGYNKSLLENFQKLLICRDAYWKIVGDWEPDWKNVYENHYTIVVYKHILKKSFNEYSNRILIFPTAEMRDAFYEHFKDLIEQCKELL